MMGVFFMRLLLGMRGRSLVKWWGLFLRVSEIRE